VAVEETRRLGSLHAPEIVLDSNARHRHRQNLASLAVGPSGRTKSQSSSSPHRTRRA